MLTDAVRFLRDPDAQRKIILAALLLSGGAPFTGCDEITRENSYGILHEFTPDECSNAPIPPVQLHDANYHAGATVSLRTPAPVITG